MEELQTRTADMVDAGQVALLRLSELAVTYSFSILGAILLIIGGYIVANIAQRSVYGALGRFRGFDETLRKFFSQIVRYAILILVGITVLAQFGVQTASIIAAVGAIGLAIGLALQGTLQNIAAGIMLLALRPFRVGEYIDAGNVSGTIQEIGLFATELKTLDGLFVLAPNSELWNTPVTNYSRNPLRRNDLTIGIGYDDDIDLAFDIMTEVVSGDERVLSDPAPDVFVSQLGDSAVDVTIRYWTSTPNWWPARLEFTKRIKQIFDEKGITIPFPQRSVHYFGQPQGDAQPVD